MGAADPRSGADEALAELTRRYFASHGPATLQDLMRWAGLTMAEVKTGLAGAGKHLRQETIEDRVYWMSCELPDLNNGIKATYLLPGFDEYLLGYSDRSAVLDPAYAQRICPGGNGVFNPTIVIASGAPEAIDGKVTGTWKRTFKKGAVVIEVAPFRPLTPAENHAVSTAAEQYGEFLGMPVA